MLTGELKNKIDQVWNAFWSGGIANPLEVIEQITYLLFLRGLDSDQMREEHKAHRAALAQLDALFASLQQRAFAGQL